MSPSFRPASPSSPIPCRIWKPRRSGSGPASAAATRSPTSTASRICSNIWRSRAPRGARSREIVEEIEAVGGDLNAGTSTETTAYYARVMKADVPLALDVLSDILANPSFVPDELEREKSVIVQEIGAAQDTPDDVVFEHLNELCYPDQPMGRSLLGTAKTLKGFDRDTLRGYLVDALSRARHGGGGGRRGRSQAGGRGSGAALRQLRAARRRRSRSRRCSARAAPAWCIASSSRRI